MPAIHHRPIANEASHIDGEALDGSVLLTVLRFRGQILEFCFSHFVADFQVIEGLTMSNKS